VARSAVTLKELTTLADQLQRAAERLRQAVKVAEDGGVDELQVHWKQVAERHMPALGNFASDTFVVANDMVSAAALGTTSTVDRYKKTVASRKERASKKAGANK
jgi:hypothetical protein